PKRQKIEFVRLNGKIHEAGKENIGNLHLFGTDNFRSWMLYFEPDDGSPTHYDHRQRLFWSSTVSARLKESKEMNGSLRKTISSSSPQKTTTSSPTSGPAP